MAELSLHFSWREAECRCGCGYSRINPLLVHKLERLRWMAGARPVIVHSWCRCGAHNQAVGGSPNSQHLYGNAADISIEGVSVDELADFAEQAGFDGIGRYYAQGFVHVDVRGYPSRWDDRA